MEHKDKTSQGLELRLYPELRVRVGVKTLAIIPGQTFQVYGSDGHFVPFRYGIHCAQIRDGMITASNSSDDVDEATLVAALEDVSEESHRFLRSLSGRQTGGSHGGFRYLRPTKFQLPGLWPLRVSKPPYRPYIEGCGASVVETMKMVNKYEQSDAYIETPVWVTPDSRGDIELYDVTSEEMRTFRSTYIPFTGRPLESLYDDDTEAWLAMLAYQASFARLVRESAMKGLFLAIPGKADSGTVELCAPNSIDRLRSYTVRLTSPRDPWMWLEGDAPAQVQAALRNDWTGPGCAEVITPMTTAALSHNRNSFEECSKEQDDMDAIMASLEV